VILIDKVKNLNEREWYVRKTVESGWSRDTLELWIESDLYHRQGKALTNFQKALPTAQSGLAEQIVKDPYSFDFIIAYLCNSLGYNFCYGADRWISIFR
jgi:predicted nuclease of restriction endonuclease-like (RecB) superfamily